MQIQRKALEDAKRVSLKIINFGGLTMLNNHGFNLWSSNYDESVKQADKNNLYPFAGYTNLMNAIYGTIMKQSPSRVLDIGFGTATLTSKLYDTGHDVTGIDFSSEMLKIAASKMPKANLIQWDFSSGTLPDFDSQSFDFIVSTYALHHLPDNLKVNFVTLLLELLTPDGSILIGDVCFRTRKDLLLCKESTGENWDDGENYFVFSEIQEQLASICELTLHEFSYCSGVIEIKKATSH